MTSTSKGGSEYGDFSNHPESVTEHTANKKESAKLWTPRDTLISALRDIDSGKLDPFVSFLAFGCHAEDGGTFTRFFTSGGSSYEIQGMVQRALWMFNE